MPTRVTSLSGPWPLHDAAAARALEARALARHPPHELMERAGLAVARLARALVPTASLVEIWCGPGNNGGDGYVAARWLQGSGTAVRLIEAVPGVGLPKDAARARERALSAGLLPIAGARALAADAASPDLVVDALLGLGASRPLQGPLLDAVSLINQRSVPVLAVDVPSGLGTDTGQPVGASRGSGTWGAGGPVGAGGAVADSAVRATHTLSLLSLKPGLFTALGRDLAGTVWFDDLCAFESRDPDTFASARLLGPALRQAMPHATHKGRRGDLWVVGGAAGMAGAAQLAARAGLSAGAGRVYVTTLAAEGTEARGQDRDRGPGLGLDAARPELMHRSLAAARGTLAKNATVVAGCGGGEAIAGCLPAILAESPRLVLDADALNATAREPALVRLLRGRAARGQRTVLTPHPLEAARLLGRDSAAVQADRISSARELGDLTQAVVVLKGSGTIVAAPGQLPAVNPSGNASLATAGTGDVLAGWLGGLWAQHPEDIGFDTACAAVWQHGHAADVAGHGERGAPLLADELIATMARSV